MEALLLPDQSISAHTNRVRNRYASMSSFSFRYPEIDSGNSYLSNHHPNNAKDSLFGNPPSVVASFSSFPSSLQQPPLLPLPLARNPSLPTKTRRLSPPSANARKSNSNKTKDQKSAPKKDSSPRSPTKSLRAASSSARLGPDPSKLPKELAPMVLRCSSSSSPLKTQSLDELDDHSGSIFSLAPHPSSLPLPRFSMRPKPAGCNAEASRSVDNGPTDDLRRLLRLPEPLVRTGSSSGDRVSGLFRPY